MAASPIRISSTRVRKIERQTPRCSSDKCHFKRNQSSTLSIPGPGNANNGNWDRNEEHAGQIRNQIIFSNNTGTGYLQLEGDKSKATEEIVYLPAERVLKWISSKTRTGETTLVHTWMSWTRWKVVICLPPEFRMQQVSLQSLERRPIMCLAVRLPCAVLARGHYQPLQCNVHHPARLQKKKRILKILL
jgi:hypothetical protein